MLSGVRFFTPPYLTPLLVSSLAVNVMALALPLMTMQVYDRVLSNHSEDTLLVLSVGVAIIALIELALRICRSVVVGINGANFEHDAATSALSSLMNTEPRRYAKLAPATLVQDIWSTARLKDYFGGQMMVTIMVDVPFTFLFLAITFYLAGWLAIVPCSVIMLFLIVARHQGKRLHQLMRDREKHDNDRYGFITRVLTAIHTVKALCLEAITCRRFEEVQRESGKVNYQIAVTQGQAGSISYGFAQLMTVGVLCAGAPLAANGTISVGALIAVVLLSGQIMQPLQRGLVIWIRYQDIVLAKQRLNELLRLPGRQWLTGKQLHVNRGEMKISGIRFAYAEGDPVLDGASLNIQHGETLAIVGRPGSGKTTLLEIMSGIYQPDKGEVKFCGMNPYHLPAAYRARNIAYLPSGGLILRGSIMDNLTGFQPHYHTEAHNIAGLLGIEEAVALLPSGYDTPMEGNSTDVVSPGLKQRIAIARSLLHRPHLILYDNADIGMDNESYQRIFSLLSRIRGRASLVLVSEDTRILGLADKSYELRHGQLSEVLSKQEAPQSSKPTPEFVS